MSQDSLGLAVQATALFKSRESMGLPIGARLNEAGRALCGSVLRLIEGHAAGVVSNADTHQQRRYAVFNLQRGGSCQMPGITERVVKRSV